MQTMRTGVNRSRIPGDFLSYLYSYGIRNQYPRTFFTYVYSYLLQDEFSEKSEVCGDLLSGRFWHWMLLMFRHFTHDSHDFKTDVPNLALKT